MSIQFIDFVEDGFDKSKFKTCKFKSSKLKKNVKLSCCGKSEEIEGVECLKRNIFPLSPKQCSVCSVYESS